MRTQETIPRHELHRAPVVRSDGKAGEPLAETEVYMTLVSLGLLLLTCVQTSPVRELAVISWLVSLALVGLRNTGAAIGIYVAAVTLYSNHFSGGQLSFFDRPDHAGLLLLIAEIGLLRRKSGRWFALDWPSLTICAFLGYGLAHGFLTGAAEAWRIGQFARTFGIPFVLVILLLRERTTLRDLQAFSLVMFIVAAYSAVVSILWVAEMRDLIFPTWILDPSVNRWVSSARAGGLLMQPASNGLFLSLVFCLTYVAYRWWIKGHARLLLIILAAALLIGIYFTYTRAIYLGTIPVVVALAWQRSDDRRGVSLKRIVVMTAAVVGIVLSLFAAPEMLRSRVGNEETVVWRLEIWKVGLRMVPARPLFGYGLRGYGENAASFLGSSDILVQQNLESSQPAVHNTLLNIVIEYGLVGFLLFGTCLYLLFRRAARSSRRLWGREGIIWLLAFLVAYFVPGQFAVLQDPSTNLLFFCTLGLLGAIVSRSGHRMGMDDANGLFRAAPGWSQADVPE